MIKEKLGIHKRYLVISSPVPFTLLANNGTDKVVRPSGVWQLDCYMLLPEKYMKNYPVFNLELEYDETKIESGFSVEYFFTDLNLGDSLKGVSGDLIELSSSQFETLKNTINQEKNVKINIEQLAKLENTINQNLVRTLDGGQFSTLMNYLSKYTDEIISANNLNLPRVLDSSQFSQLMQSVSNKTFSLASSQFEEILGKITRKEDYLFKQSISADVTLNSILLPIGCYIFEIGKYADVNGRKTLLETIRHVYVNDKYVSLESFVKLDSSDYGLHIKSYSADVGKVDNFVETNIDLRIGGNIGDSVFEFDLSIYPFYE